MMPDMTRINFSRYSNEYTLAKNIKEYDTFIGAIIGLCTGIINTVKEIKNKKSLDNDFIFLKSNILKKKQKKGERHPKTNQFATFENDAAQIIAFSECDPLSDDALNNSNKEALKTALNNRKDVIKLIHYLIHNLTEKAKDFAKDHSKKKSGKLFTLSKKVLLAHSGDGHKKDQSYYDWLKSLPGIDDLLLELQSERERMTSEANMEKTLEELQEVEERMKTQAKISEAPRV